jgi:hypothetical protein
VLGPGSRFIDWILAAEMVAMKLCYEAERWHKSRRGRVEMERTARAATLFVCRLGKWLGGGYH